MHGKGLCGLKLSMWMIANRLSPLMDISVYIRADAKPVLNSARVAYSTNTAHVYPSGKNVIVEGEGDQIVIYDIRLKEAFEIIQGVFDYYKSGRRRWRTPWPGGITSIWWTAAGCCSGIP